MRQTVPPAEAGRRLDQWLTEQTPDISRSQVRRWIEMGHVTVNGSVVKAGHPLRADEVVTWNAPPPVPHGIAPPAEDLAITLVHVDDDLVVVDKPAGMVVHPAAGVFHGTLVSALLGRGLSLATLGGPLRPGIIHRLDKGTSGLLVVARTDRAHEALARAITLRQIDRRYRALVWGDIAIPTGRIEAAITRSRADRKKMTITRSGGRSAVTHWKVRARHRLVTDLDLKLETGRTHQIRVHWRHEGHPVFGDPAYGGRSRGASLSPDDRRLVTSWLSLVDRQALHACRLEFDHPVHGGRMTFTVPLPPDMEELFERVAGGQSGSP
ncbi:MAG: RluA family pseudouridine synthase [Candidatus Eisenbacteria bacterium]|nr:RluA family pseudouridine synthase [Candidatus Eisenbacteria bacterium]